MSDIDIDFNNIKSVKYIGSRKEFSFLLFTILLKSISISDIFYYHLIIIEPQVKPPPRDSKTIISPSLILLFLTL